ncbi:MAG: hypothetical protein QOF08_2477 [Gaiellales bacterium]|nr:hypothetical protein [Gaiellales bacterium]
MPPADEPGKDDAREPEPKHSASPGKGRNAAHPQEGAREGAAEPDTDAAPAERPGTG